MLFAAAAGFALAGYGVPRFGATTYEPEPRGAGNLRVVTWNVGGAKRGGGETLNDQWLEHVAGVLVQLDADLVLLQELASADQARRLVGQIGDRFQLAVRDQSGRRLAVLAQRGPVEVLSPRRAPAQVMVVHYEQIGQPPVIVANVHAEAYSARRRNRTLGRAAGMLRRFARTNAMILAGDFNLDVDLDKRRDLFTNNEHPDVEAYNVVAMELTDATVGTGSTAEPDRRLDYIFVSPDHFDVVRSGPWKGRRVGNMDHDPVVADLRRRLPVR